MSIRPIDAYPGKVAAPTAEYPDGKAQNIASPGDGTGTPWEAALVNDIFGFQQYLTSKAGITPSGTPDDATTSQYFEAIWALLNVRGTTHNFTADADYTLTADENLYGRVILTDSSVFLTTGRNVIVNTVERLIFIQNNTAQTLTIKTLAGTGIAVPAGVSTGLLVDGTNVIYAPSNIQVNPAFRATGASQAFTANVTTKLAANTEQLDNTNAYDSTTNYRFTPQKEGWYKVHIQMRATSGNFGASIHVYKNGAPYERLQSAPATTIIDTISGESMVFLNGTTDYIEAYGGWASNNTAISVFDAHFIVGV